MTRIDKRFRGKPLPVSDLQQVSKFRAELEVYKRLRDEGKSHVDAMRAVFGTEGR